MSAGESTPAPASVEQAASQCAKETLDLLSCSGSSGHGRWIDADAACRMAYLRGHADAASADRAALARANGLLREALEALHGEHDRQRVGMAPLRRAINEHLGEPSA